MTKTQSCVTTMTIKKSSTTTPKLPYATSQSFSFAHIESESLKDTLMKIFKKTKNWALDQEEICTGDTSLGISAYRLGQSYGAETCLKHKQNEGSLRMEPLETSIFTQQMENGESNILTGKARS